MHNALNAFDTQTQIKLNDNKKLCNLHTCIFNQYFYYSIGSGGSKSTISGKYYYDGITGDVFRLTGERAVWRYYTENIDILHSWLIS